MGEIKEPLIFPTFEEIVKNNHLHLTKAGQPIKGIDNLKEPGSLKWVLDAIQYPLFGSHQYPSIAEKAGILVWVIIDGHVFWDGSKRTGMSVLNIFLRVNGYRLKTTNEEIVEIALRIGDIDAEKEYTRKEFVEWIKKKLTILD